MDIYGYSLILGSAGLTVMAIGGFGRHAGQARGGHALHSGHQGHGGHAAHSGHAGHTGHSARGHQAGAVSANARSLTDTFWSLASPMLLFSVLLGFGATGLVLHRVLGGVLLAGAAVAGAVLFERLIISQLWKLLLRFASTPALTIDSVLEDEARAVSGFDNNGCGLISVEMDGQVRQLLGTLTPADLTSGVRVRAGDRLRVEAVDGARNRVTVSYIGS
jgi:hypothetical protein